MSPVESIYDKAIIFVAAVAYNFGIAIAFGVVLEYISKKAVARWKECLLTTQARTRTGRSARLNSGMRMSNHLRTCSLMECKRWAGQRLY
jgi:hypothetical protein